MEEVPWDRTHFQCKGTQGQEDPPIRKGLQQSWVHWHHHWALQLCTSSARSHTEKIVGKEHDSLIWANLEDAPMVQYYDEDVSLGIQHGGVMTEELKDCWDGDKNEVIEELCCGFCHLVRLGHCTLQKCILRCWHLKARILFTWTFGSMMLTLQGMSESLTHYPTH